MRDIVRLFWAQLVDCMLEGGMTVFYISKIIDFNISIGEKRVTFILLPQKSPMQSPIINIIPLGKGRKKGWEGTELSPFSTRIVFLYQWRIDLYL